MSYDFNKWVENDLAERRYRWVRWACLLPFAAGPLAFLCDTALAGMPGSDAAAPLLWLTAIGGFFVALWSPFMRELWRPHGLRRGRVFDEREEAVLARAHARSFAIVVAALLTVFLYAWLAMEQGWWLPRSEDDLSALFRLFCFTVPVLPVAIAEWTVPLPPADEAD